MVRTPYKYACQPLVWLALAACTAQALGAGTPPAHDPPATQPAAVHVAILEYTRPHSTAPCFADRFLSEVANQAHVVMDPRLAVVELGSDDLFRYPFVVITGEDAFRLNDHEARNLREYLTRGGFLLATAGCSSAAWAKSFKAAVAQAFGAASDAGKTDPPKWSTLTLKHPIFHQIYDIDRLVLKQVSDDPVAVQGLELNGRLAVVFCDAGLNDTAHTGGKCCCCGRNELQDASRIDANILAYALLH